MGLIAASGGLHAQMQQQRVLQYSRWLVRGQQREDCHSVSFTMLGPRRTLLTCHLPDQNQAEPIHQNL